MYVRIISAEPLYFAQWDLGFMFYLFQEKINQILTWQC